MKAAVGNSLLFADKMSPKLKRELVSCFLVKIDE
jgi:hypothetical protein